MAGLGRTHLVLREEDVVKLVCEFLENRAMTISQVSLERESGVINGNLSDDIVFLRQLILDGQWEDCLEFIQPLATLHTFDYNLFNFLILKHKFVELLCIKNEIPLGNTDSAVEEVVKVLKEIEVNKFQTGYTLDMISKRAGLAWPSHGALPAPAYHYFNESY